MALETEAGFEFVGHQLEVGWLLERDELLEEGDSFPDNRCKFDCEPI